MKIEIELIDHADGKDLPWYQGYQGIAQTQAEDGNLLQIIWVSFEQEETLNLYVNDESLLGYPPLARASMDEVDKFAMIRDNAIEIYDINDPIDTPYEERFNEMLEELHIALQKKGWLDEETYAWSWKIKRI